MELLDHDEVMRGLRAPPHARGTALRAGLASYFLMPDRQVFGFEVDDFVDIALTQYEAVAGSYHKAVNLRRREMKKLGFRSPSDSTASRRIAHLNDTNARNRMTEFSCMVLGELARKDPTRRRCRIVIDEMPERCTSRNHLSHPGQKYTPAGLRARPSKKLLKIMKTKGKDKWKYDPFKDGDAFALYKIVVYLEYEDGERVPVTGFYEPEIGMGDAYLLALCAGSIQAVMAIPNISVIDVLADIRWDDPMSAEVLRRIAGLTFVIRGAESGRLGQSKGNRKSRARERAKASGKIPLNRKEQAYHNLPHAVEFPGRPGEFLSFFRGPISQTDPGEGTQVLHYRPYSTWRAGQPLLYPGNTSVTFLHTNRAATLENAVATVESYDHRFPAVETGIKDHNKWIVRGSGPGFTTRLLNTAMAQMMELLGKFDKFAVLAKVRRAGQFASDFIDDVMSSVRSEIQAFRDGLKHLLAPRG